MSIPYRARQALRRFVVGILVLILFAVLLLFCWLLWLDRYVVYTRDGAMLDFSLSVNYAPGESPVEPTGSTVPQIHSNDSADDSGDASSQFAQLSGYYVTLSQLTEDFDAVRQQMLSLPKGSTIMLQLKDIRGLAYYSSSVMSQSTSFDVTQMDALIQELLGDGHYLIAQIPAFQDYYFIMANERERVPYGLAKTGGNGSLWLDTSGSLSCYWLNPASDGTLTFLIQQVTELRSLGFDEVVFSDFRFPDTTSVVFNDDRMSALVDTAAKLVKTCSTEAFCVSFTRASAGLTLPEGRTRLYLTGISATDLDTTVEAAGLTDPAVQMVFLTDSGDPRFDNYGVLRPLESAES